MKEQHQKVKQEKLELNAKLDAHLQHWKLLCVCVSVVVCHRSLLLVCGI